MIESLKKNKLFLFAFGGIFVAYFLTRLFHLTIIPIFTDEAIYIRWSQIMAYDASLRYITLVDGKQPLFMWLVSALIRLLHGVDILAIGRIGAVLSGAFGMAGVYFAGFWLYNKKNIGIFAMLIYLLSPFAFLYDRMALADSLLAAFATWSFALSILLVKYLRLDVALILGISVGLGLLTKSPALFSLINLPLFLLLFDWKKTNLIKRLAMLAGLTIIPIVLSQAIYSILRLFPLFHMIAQKNGEFLVKFSDFVKNPLFWVQGNFIALSSWEITYLTLPIVLVGLFAIYKSIINKKLESVVILGSFGTLFLEMVVLNKIIYPRYLLTFTPILFVLVAYGLDQIKNQIPRKAFLVFLILIFSFPVWTICQLMFSPLSAQIPEADSHQYLNSWSAGFGVREVVAFLKGESLTNKKITIGTEGTFGLMPYSLDLYHDQYPNVDIKSFWPVTNVVPEEIQKSVKSGLPTYFLMYQDRNAPDGWKLGKPLIDVNEGKSLDHMRLYKLTAENVKKS